MITLVIADFRAAFPQFASAVAFPDALVTLQYNMATGFVSDSTYGCMTVLVRTSALYLMTAHLLSLGAIIADGGTYQGAAGIVTQSKVGDVSVSLAQPPYGTSAWRYWLSLTPYGAQLLALLDVQSAGGFYIGGLPERAAFRKVGGIFG